PRELQALEPGIVKAVKNRIARGSVEVFVRRQGADEALGAPTVDLGLAREYFAALTSLASELRLTGEVRVQDLAAQPGVLRLEERQVDLTRAAEATHSALSEALGKLTQMREAEGEAIEEDLRGRVNALQSLADEIKAIAPQVVAQYHQRLSERLSELARGVAI